MPLRSKKILYAVSILAGSIIGVGIFGLPYIASKVGFWPIFFYLCGGAIIVLAVHLIYSQIIIARNRNERLPGQVNDVFGKKWGTLVFINFLLGLFASQLVYIIVGGKFLYGLVNLFYPASLTLCSLIFFVFGSFLIYKDIEYIAQAEFLMLIFLILIVFVIFFLSIPKINIANFARYDLKNIFLPYGIVIFSFWGTSILPEFIEMLAGKKRKKNQDINKEATRANIYAILISLFTYLFFVIAVLGVSGAMTSMEAFEGLKPFFSQKIMYAAYLFGFLCVFTSFLASGLTIKKCFIFDYKLSNKLSFILSTSIPIFLFFLNFQNFISIINFIGNFTFGIAGISIFALYLKLKKTKKIKNYLFSNYTVYAMMILFLSGIILCFKK
ncbi:MAG: aromatic amino acid transport family protein [bacterium]